VKPFTIFACESQPVIVEGLAHLLSNCDDLQLCGYAADIDVALQQLESTVPDVFLLGQPPTAKSVLPLLSRAKQIGISGQLVVWVSELSDMDSFRALQMGARGVVTRTQPLDGLMDCLRAVGAGEVWLKSTTEHNPAHAAVSLRITPREREIVELVCEGLRNREIADRMSITPGTVKVHLMHIFEKTGVKDRFQLALQGRQLLAASSKPVVVETEPLAALSRVAGAY
jgi:two-component system nitrate/nitrite response regulator NarL